MKHAHFEVQDLKPEPKQGPPLGKSFCFRALEVRATCFAYSKHSIESSFDEKVCSIHKYSKLVKFLLYSYIMLYIEFFGQQ